MTRRPRLLPIITSAAAVVLLLGMLELAADAYVMHFANEPRFLQYASLRQWQRHPVYGKPQRQRYTAHKYLGYIPTPDFRNGADRHNALGYRGEEIVQPKPTGQVRIACLGESTTYDVSVEDYRQSYPYLLQQLLLQQGAGVDVVNAGAGGWSSWESLINFPLRLLDLSPDILIIHYGMNDAHTRFVWPPQAYRGDNSGSEAPRPEGIGMPGLLEYSTLARFFLVRLGFIQSHSALRRNLLRTPPSAHSAEYIRQQLDKTYPSGIFREVTAEAMLKANPPVYFRRNLENLAALARHHGVMPVFVTFPYSSAFADPAVSSPAFKTALEEGNAVIRSLESRDVPVFDLARVFGGDAGYFTDGYHTTAAGSRKKAALIADFLKEKKLLGQAARR